MRSPASSVWASSLCLLAVISSSLALTTTIDLGTAIHYAVLAESAITNVPQSSVGGNVGLSPAAAAGITGFDLVLDSSGKFAKSSQVFGQVFAADYASPTPSTLSVAIGDMLSAYNSAAGRVADYVNEGAGEIGGMTLTPGVHKFDTSVTVSSNVFLSGTCNDVFIFQISGTYAQAPNTDIVLVGGVRPSQVFWQASGTFTVGASAQGASFQGIVLAATQVTLTTGSTITGRIYSQTAIAIQQTSIMQPQDSINCGPSTVTLTQATTVVSTLPGATSTITSTAPASTTTLISTIDGVRTTIYSTLPASVITSVITAPPVVTTATLTAPITLTTTLAGQITTILSPITVTQTLLGSIQTIVSTLPAATVLVPTTIQGQRTTVTSLAPASTITSLITAPGFVTTSVITQPGVRTTEVITQTLPAEVSTLTTTIAGTPTVLTTTIPASTITNILVGPVSTETLISTVYLPVTTMVPTTIIQGGSTIYQTITLIGSDITLQPSTVTVISTETRPAATSTLTLTETSLEIRPTTITQSVATRTETVTSVGIQTNLLTVTASGTTTVVTSLVPTTNVQTKTVTEQGSTSVSSTTETITQTRVVTTEISGGLFTTTMLVPTIVTKALDQTEGGSAQIFTKTIVQGGSTVVTQVPVTRTLTQVSTTTLVGSGNGGGGSSVETGSATAATEQVIATQSFGQDTATEGVSIYAIQGGYTTVTAQQATGTSASQATQAIGTMNGGQAGDSGTGCGCTETIYSTVNFPAITVYAAAPPAETTTMTVYECSTSTTVLLSDHSAWTSVSSTPSPTMMTMMNSAQAAASSKSESARMCTSSASSAALSQCMATALSSIYSVCVPTSAFTISSAPASSTNTPSLSTTSARNATIIGATSGGKRLALGSFGMTGLITSVIAILL